jgi:hypothetical protein
LTNNFASATNTTPSPAPADIASKGLATHSIAQEEIALPQATNNTVSGRLRLAACAVHLGAQSSSDASAVFLIAIIREAKCHPVEIQSYICVDRGEDHGIAGVGTRALQVGPPPVPLLSVTARSAKIPGDRDRPGHSAPKNAAARHYRSNRHFTGHFSLSFSRIGFFSPS